jgi:hypothetical protein
MQTPMPAPMRTLSLLESDTDDATWDGLLADLPQPTVFSRSGFLRALGCRHRRMELRDGHRRLALLALTENEAGDQLLPQPFTPYQGPLFLHAPDSTARQRQQDEFRASTHLAEALAGRYTRLRLALPWQLQDMRPWLWHDYHAANAPHYHATPRYTAVLPLTGLDADTYLARVRSCRRQEWRKAAGLALHDDVAVADFLVLYAATFERQGLQIDPGQLAVVRRITEAALAGGWGSLSGCSGPIGTLASATLFVNDGRRSYYLFGANDPAQRASGASTRLLVHNILQAAGRGLAELDFVGVNSPDRGDFKLSFDPTLCTHFELHRHAH